MKELKVALAAAKAGAEVILKYHGKSFKVGKKGEINLVTEVDEKAQKAIMKVIRKYFPKDALLAEEGDFATTATAPRRWVIDPIDGTTNFAHSYPVFCVSIAFELNGEIVCGVIHDPTRKEVFTAIKGKGAFLNKKRLKVTNRSILRECLLVTGFPYDLDNPEYNNVPYFLHFIRKGQAVRRDGSAALNLAYVAAGRFDGFWELSLNRWDYAAGILLITEAGGIVKHLSGRELKMSDQAVIASGPNVFDEFLAEAKNLSKLK